MRVCVLKKIIKLSVTSVLTLFLFSSVSFLYASNSKKTVGDLLKRVEAENRGKNVKLQKSRSSLPSGGQFQAYKLKKKDLSSVKPPSTSKIIMGSDRDQVALEKITDQTIRELYRMTRKFSKSRNRGELWVRLGEAYLDKARIVEFREQDRYDKELKNYLEKKTSRKPRLNLKEIHEYNKKAIQLYEWYVRDFPNDIKTDQALYYLGYSNFEIDHIKKGENYFKLLLKKFPKSPYVGEANFSLGEYYFENNRWKEAYQHYMKVVNYKGARLYNFALFKSAWCLFRIGEVGKAIAYLEKLVRQRPSRKEVDKLRLKQEALNDIVLFFGEGGDYKRAIPFFESLVGAQQSFSYLERLAYYYSDKGAREGARFLFKRLIAMKPRAEKTFDYQYQIVLNYAYASKSRVFRDELYTLVKNFGVSSDWLRSQKDKKQAKISLGKTEALLKNYVLQQHKAALTTRSAYSKKIAIDAYQLYLKEIPENPNSFEIRFFYGELLYEFKDYKRAALQYRAVAEAKNKSKYGKLAALNALLAYEQTLPNEKELLRKVGKRLEKIPLDPNSNNFINSAKFYVTTYPDAERMPEIKFRSGRLFYLHNHFDEAILVFKDIVKSYPRTKYAEYSANLLLDIYNIRKDYKGLVQVGNELLANPLLAQTAAGKDIRGVMEKSQFQQAQSLEENKKYIESAKQYEDFSKKNPRSDLAVSARFNAAVNYEKGKDFVKAIALYGTILGIRGSKHNDLREKAKKQIANLYRDTGDYMEAAKAFERLAVENPRDPLVSNYHYNAAVIWDGFKWYDSAIKNYEAYFQKSKSADRVEVIFLIGEIWRKRNDSRKAIQYYERFLNSAPRNAKMVIEAHYKIVQMNEKRGYRTKAKEWKEKTIAVQRRLGSQGGDEGAYYAALCKFDLVKENYDKLVRLRIPSNPAQQQKVVQEKLSLVNRLSNDLASVIKYDNSSGIVASLTLSGMTNDHMAEALLSAPKPAGLNAEEMKEYMAGVENLANPFKKKALESFSAAVDRGIQFDVFDKWFKEAKSGLRKYDNQKMPATGETGFPITVVDWIGMHK